MIKDPLANLLINILSGIGCNITQTAAYVIYIFLYNFMPAVIFGPLLIYKGLQYHDNVLVVIGCLLIFIDMVHLLNNSKRLICEGTIY